VSQEPIHIISLGAGVQSSTMALMAASGEITPMPQCAIFADTQAEPKSVYTWLDWLEKQLPFPVHRVTRGNLGDEVVKIHTTKTGRTVTRSGIPYYTLDEKGTAGISLRQCTYDFKISPLIRKAKSIAEHCVMWIGISTDEVSRIKDSREKRIEHRWPLIEKGMDRRGCLKWFATRGLPTPPRSACVFCPYHSSAEWRRLKVEEHQEFQRAVNFERDLQEAKAKILNNRSKPFLHPSLIPLSEVDFSTEEERGQLNMFNNECEGMCGV
jgi:hypothetical protein